MKRTPIKIVVTDSRYDAFGDPFDWWHVFLMKTLTNIGGINETVEPGEYEFNVLFKGLRMYSSLTPMK